jgi:two-component system, LytTR family, sensor kinase
MRMTRITRWGLVTLFWMGWSAACASFMYSWRLAIGKPVVWITIAPFYFAAYAVWGPIFSPITVSLAKRFTIEKTDWLRSVLVHMMLAPCVCLVHGFLTTMMDPWLWPDMNSRDPFFHALRRNFLATAGDDIFIYWSIVFMVQGWLYYQRYRDRELRASVLETQLAKAQLQALKVQLHPHFLFNTLNSVTELMHQDVHVAERVITRLSDLLRMTLENIGTQEVTLRDEFEFVKGYLEIEQTRFQDRLRISYDISPEVLDACVPNLLLQPVVENAIRHGIAKSSKQGIVHIEARKEGSNVVLSVFDNGPGLKINGKSPAANFGIGLSTTRTRLDFLYGVDQYSLTLKNRPEGGLEARIVIPFSSNLVTVAVPEPLTIPSEVRPTLEGVRS